VKLAAAWLIEHAGLARGTRDGLVGLSEHHTLALSRAPAPPRARWCGSPGGCAGPCTIASGSRWCGPVPWGFSRLIDGLPALDD
jgi:hypothetical protein